MADMKVQGEFEMDTTKGEDALARVESGARRMASTVKQAGDSAASALGGMGDKAEQSARVMERANAALATAARKAVSEQQRAIVEAQGYSLKSAEGLEELARVRGGDVQAIQGQIGALRELRSQHEALVASQRAAAGTALFEQQHAAAKKLVQDAEYVRVWTSALDLLDAKQRELAALPAFERDREAAEQARRRTDATFALTQALDIQEARERELAALPAFQREQAAADQARRRADATAALTQVLDQQEAAERRLATQNGFLASLKSQSDGIGKTRSELLALQAAQLGVSDKAAPMIARLREQEAGFAKLGTSAGQTRAALAQLPMQFSDIVVSLQGGQAPLTVFLQQGAQIKDSFGGAGAALKAMGGYVLGLVNPFTAAAAAVGVVALAYNQGSKEADGYRNALILTGNAAGTTSGQLKAYAQDIGGIVGTQGKAAESLTALAASGKVSAEVLRDAGLAAVQYERATGQAVSKTAEQFASLRNEPLSGVLKLNEGMNFLTESTYRQIKSLEEQGKTAEAARVAQEAYANALSGRSAEVERNLGGIERAWKSVADSAKKAWDNMLGVGRAQTTQDRLKQVRDEIAAVEKQLDGGRGFVSTEGGAAYGSGRGALNAAAQQQLRDRLAGLGAQAAALEGVTFAEKAAAEAARERADQMRAAQAWDKDGAKYLSDAAKLERDLTQARNEGTAAGKSQAEINERLAKIREEYAKKGGGAAAAKAEQSAYATLIASVKARLEQNEQEIATGAKLNEAQKLRIQLVAQLESGSRKMTAARQAETKASLDDLDASERRLAVAQAQRKFEGERDKENSRLAEEISKINQKAQALEDEAAVYGKTADELRALTVERLNEQKAMLMGFDGSQQRIDQLNDEIAAVQRLGAAETKIADLKLGSSSDELLNNAHEQAKLYEDEVRLIGLSAVERQKVVALRQVELKYAKELERINKSGASDDAKEAARIKALEAKQIESQAAVSKVVEEDWNKTSQLIGDTLADYIMGGGKDAAQYLKRLFATLVLQPLVQIGVGGVLGALGLGGGGAGASGGGSFLGMASNAVSAYRAGSQLYTIGGQYLGGTMSGANAAGTVYANYAGTGIDGLLATNGAYGTAGGGAGAGASTGSLAGAGGFLAAVALVANAFGAFASNKIVGGGLQGTLGGDDLSTYQLWRTGGTLFSGPSYRTQDPAKQIKEYEKELETIRGAGNGSSYRATWLQDQIKFLNERYGPDIAQGKKQSDAIQEAYKAMRTNVGDMADVLGLDSSKVRKYTMAVGTDVIHPDTGGMGIKFDGLDANGIQQKIQEALASANNALAEQVIGSWVTTTETVRRTIELSRPSSGDSTENLQGDYREVEETVTRTHYVASEFARDGENAIATLTRLATSLTTVNGVFEDLGTTLYASSLAGGDMASQLIDLFGNADNFRGAASTYLQNFYSQDEQREAVRRQLQKQLDTVDLKLPDINAADARAQFRSLAEAQDLTTEAGRKAYAMLLQLAGSFAAVTDGAAASLEAERQKKIADTRAGLEERLLAAQGKDRAVLDLRRKQEYDALWKLDPELAKLVAKIYELEDASKAAADAAARAAEIEAKGFDIEQRRLIAEGRDREALDLRRKQEYDALWKLDPALAKATAKVWELEDAAAALAAAEEARGNAMRDLADAMGRQREMWEGQLEVIDTQRQVQQEALGLITGIFDLVRSNARDLYGEVQSTAAMQAAQGNAFIAQALTTAMRTGYLPEQDALQQAISGARAGLDSSQYRSQVDADFARLVLAGQLRALEEIAGPQKTAAEKQIDALDSQTETLNKLIKDQQKEYDLIQRQVDIANGTYNATITVAQATANIFALLSGKTPGATGSGPGAAGGGSTGGAGEPVWGGTATSKSTGVTPYVPPAYVEPSGGTAWGGTMGPGSANPLNVLFVDDDGRAHYADGSVGPARDGWVDESGHWVWAKNNPNYGRRGMLSFAVGTNYVPRDMVANIHEGERIIPAADNRALMAAVNAGGQGNSSAMAEVVAELRAVKAQLAAVRASTAASAESTSQLAEQTDSVTEGGNANRVEIMNVKALAKALAEELAA